ncbi:16S rRNA (cytidine(1402)-2'-O)-methyltransferase [Candidatus Gracilibacteria bacterium]|nr:MAG: 16S rRNA (cytidine(1402)-2'-O)-methyltransferase [Candidatus Gracilibacteria bacterium]PIE85611.1 MAG: 16S rRNA (cytidine(1402)-2'-O)-methyltransferase [Candidatus Gracilibacteria bacterium]
MLYIVSTPIGNLGDITYRAVETLKEVDIIACEDTRKSMILLNHYDIKKPLISFHSHSGFTKVDKIISELKNDKNIALISDAGTPGISDPGYVLIKEALLEGLKIVPIPGVTAFTTALSASGMQMNHFLYLGFLPVKKGRQTLFKMLVERKKTSSETVVIYESVHRLIKTLKELLSYFGQEHNIVVARELTKKFEEFKRDNIINIINYFEENPSKVKGEFVILF